MYSVHPGEGTERGSSSCLQANGDNGQDDQIIVISLLLFCCYLEYLPSGYLSYRQEPGRGSLQWRREGAISAYLIYALCTFKKTFKFVNWRTVSCYFFHQQLMWQR